MPADVLPEMGRVPTDAEILAAAQEVRKTGTASTKAWAERRVASERLRLAEDAATAANDRHAKAQKYLGLLLSADCFEEAGEMMKTAVQRAVAEIAAESVITS